MTKKVFDEQAKRLEEYRRQIKELQKMADEVEESLKTDLKRRGSDELQTEHFVVRWKEIETCRLDGKALKAALPEIYQEYSRNTTNKRFTMTAA